MLHTEVVQHQPVPGQQLPRVRGAPPVPLQPRDGLGRERRAVGGDEHARVQDVEPERLRGRVLPEAGVAKADLQGAVVRPLQVLRAEARRGEEALRIGPAAVEAEAALVLPADADSENAGNASILWNSKGTRMLHLNTSELAHQFTIRSQEGRESR